MKVSYPEYYERFRCLAGECPDSCCKEWAVAIDEASAEYYRSLPGALGDALRSALQEEDGDIILALTEDRRCPMWRRDGLCRIHAELGEEALCHTCTQFPRLRHDYGDFAELGLELSCPEAARLILDYPQAKMITVTEEDIDEPDYDPDVMSTLLRSRTEVLKLLSGTKYSPGEALAILLLYAYRVQEELDGGAYAEFAPEADLQRAKSIAGGGDGDALLRIYRNLEILTPQWDQRLSSPAGSCWERRHLALARYFAERYWLQAVSDLDLLCRVKFLLASCLVIKLLGGDLTQTAQLYSKEIENDPDNVEALLDAAYTESAMADIKLLDLLLTV